MRVWDHLWGAPPASSPPPPWSCHLSATPQLTHEPFSRRDQVWSGLDLCWSHAWPLWVREGVVMLSPEDTAFFVSGSYIFTPCLPGWSLSPICGWAASSYLSPAPWATVSFYCINHHPVQQETSPMRPESCISLRGEVFKFLNCFKQHVSVCRVCMWGQVPELWDSPWRWSCKPFGVDAGNSAIVACSLRHGAGLLTASRVSF